MYKASNLLKLKVQDCVLEVRLLITKADGALPDTAK